MIPPIRRTYRSASTTIRETAFAWGARTYLMGIVNVTPDSFSGDGTGGDVAAAVERARAMEAAGADILDIGAESSRPGAKPLPAQVELARLLPSLKGVREATGLPISVDTYHAEVANAALRAGADAINDIHGLRADPELGAVVASYGATLIAMHNQRGRVTQDVANAIRAGFAEIIEAAGQAGIAPGQLVLDPGFGFGWKPEENLEMLRRLPELWDLELPLLLGTSRKSTIGMVLDAPVEERMEGTAATVALAIAGGADIVRIHDVAEMARVARVSDAIVRANWRSQ